MDMEKVFKEEDFLLDEHEELCYPISIEEALNEICTEQPRAKHYLK